jgi:hypothetical protein
MVYVGSILKIKKSGEKEEIIKGIVSRDWGRLQMALFDR